MKHLVQLTTEPISIEDTYRDLDDPVSGAAVVFVGRVRNHNDGRSVQKILYTAYTDMVRKEGEKILKEAASQHDVCGMLIKHYVGTLSVGGVSVAVGVASKHRKNAFSAAEWIMDEVKKRLPVWKEEFYDDGDRAWPHNTP